MPARKGLRKLHYVTWPNGFAVGDAKTVVTSNAVNSLFQSTLETLKPHKIKNWRRRRFDDDEDV